LPRESKPGAGAGGVARCLTRLVGGIGPPDQTCPTILLLDDRHAAAVPAFGSGPVATVVQDILSIAIHLSVAGVIVR
jgi:hypothetical protein